jgi:hypothetical protein
MHYLGAIRGLKNLQAQCAAQTEHAESDLLTNCMTEDAPVNV